MGWLDNRAWAERIQQIAGTLLMAALAITGVASAQGDGLERLTMTFENLERTYALHVPDQLNEAAPLVLALHGRFGDGPSMARLTDFNTLADTEGFIVAYPDGVNTEWNYVHDIPGYDAQHDDVAFLNALVDEIAATYPVDLSRVYITGYSNGGFMAQRVACENPTRFAAFATVAAAGFGGMDYVCAEPGTVGAPMLMIHGTADDNVPWNGIGVQRGSRTVYVLYPVAETLGFWAEFNGCEPELEARDLPVLGDSPGTSVSVLTVDCPDDSRVVLYAVSGGGHTWPGHSSRVPESLSGLINRDIDATVEIWRFFEEHQRERSNP